MDKQNSNHNTSLSCFVIMPLSDTEKIKKDQWEFIFEKWIKKAVESYKGADIKCYKSSIEPGNFVNGIVKSLKTADIVIADMTNKKPNVCYELGVRHVFSNGNIIITQDSKDYPSDLSSYSYLKYEYAKESHENDAKFSKFEKDIHDQIKTIINRRFSSDNPVSDYLEIEKSITRNEAFTNSISQKTFADLLDLSPKDFKGLEIAISYYKDGFPWIYEYSKGLVQMLNSNSPNIEKRNMIYDFLSKLDITFKNKDLRDYYATDKNFQLNFSYNYMLLKYYLKVIAKKFEQNTTGNSTYNSMAALKYINEIKDRTNKIK